MGHFVVLSGADLGWRSAFSAAIRRALDSLLRTQIAEPNRHRPGIPEFLPVPACASFNLSVLVSSSEFPRPRWSRLRQEFRLPAGAVLAPYRVRRGKNGVTSKGILSRADVIATGCALTISTLSSQALRLYASAEGQGGDLVELVPVERRGRGRRVAQRVTVPFSAMLLPRCACSRAPSCGARICSTLMNSPAAVKLLRVGRVLQHLDELSCRRRFLLPECV